MSSFAVRVENLSKRYRIGRNEPAQVFRDALVNTLTTPFRSLHSTFNARSESSMIWALKDVSFDIKYGEVVGIVGRNGAGKSTLLKILTRITKPTGGRVLLHGRVGSLLEVGTGFNPELSGRQNVYLNGAILGMRTSEIDRKFDEIVAFAEIEKFIDTPVKHYSSGMAVRLAFAVAAHLEPEIMIIDEVLAVGDAEFQKKCLGKMDDMAKDGRTVLFVSHNMPAVIGLCSRGVWLKNGMVEADGPAYEIVSRYLRGDHATSAEKTWAPSQAPGNEIVRLRSAKIQTEGGQAADSFDIRELLCVEMEFDVLQPGHILVPGFHFFTETGAIAFQSMDQSPGWKRRPRPAGRFVSTARIPGNFLAEGQMVVGVSVITARPKRIHFFEQNALAFHIVDSLDGDTARGDFAGHMPGVVRPLLQWTTQFSETTELVRDNG
jgi:lipopolysaccharide transport system ATP-binding protein